MGAEGGTYVDIILKLDTSGAVEFYTFQSLTNDIIRLALRLLSCFDHGSFIEVAAVVDVQLVECILKSKDLALVQLREPPRGAQGTAVSELFCTIGEGARGLLELEDIHLSMRCQWEGGRGRDGESKARREVLDERDRSIRWQWRR